MIPMLAAHSLEPCILVGGILDGKEDLIATIGPNAPCDVKKYIHNSKLLNYRIKWLSKGDGSEPCKFEKDSKGRYVLYFDKPFKEEINK